MALYTIGREFNEQGRVPDCIERTLYVEGDASNFMSGIEDLYPWLGEQKQHMHWRVSWSESKLMIGNQALGEEEGFVV